MSPITVQQLKELRQRTGAGMLDCRQALEQAEGNMEHAIEYPRKQAAAEAAKRAARLTGEGQVGSYIRHDAKVGARVEVNCECARPSVRAISSLGMRDGTVGIGNGQRGRAALSGRSHR